MKLCERLFAMFPVTSRQLTSVAADGLVALSPRLNNPAPKSKIPSAMKQISLPKSTTLIALLCATAMVATLQAADKTSENKATKVLFGPAEAKLADVAALKVPAQFAFLNGDQTRSYLKKGGQPVSGNEMGLLIQTNDEWSVYFDYMEVGYVKDDDKDKLNASKLLKSIKEGNEEANKERVANGAEPLEIVGWEKEPTYDPTSHNLEWCLRCRSRGRDILNYNTRLLGRKGVMEVVLVVSPDKFKETLPKFRETLAGYQYQSGQTYAEYKSGDKVAKYGLGALVVGGAAVGAAKLGLFAWLGVFLKKFFKPIIVAVIAIGAFFKNAFLRLFGKRDDGPSD